MYIEPIFLGITMAKRLNEAIFNKLNA